MLEQTSEKHTETRRETGLLVFKKHCYALQCSDGAEYWLEMGSSPCHLLDERVAVVGEFFPPNVVFVDSIQPV